MSGAVTGSVEGELETFFFGGSRFDDLVDRDGEAGDTVGRGTGWVAGEMWMGAESGVGCNTSVLAGVGDGDGVSIPLFERDIAVGSVCDLVRLDGLKLNTNRGFPDPLAMGEGSGGDMELPNPLSPSLSVTTPNVAASWSHSRALRLGPGEPAGLVGRLLAGKSGNGRTFGGGRCDLEREW